jgi:hypothetical protein
MAFDQGLAERIRDAVRARAGISERRMFGGLAFMLQGHMFAGILGETLMARVGPNGYAEALREPWVRKMDFTGKPMKGYVFVAPEGFESDVSLELWIARCIRFVESLPPRP